MAPFALISWWVRTDRTRAHYEEYRSQMHVLEESGLLIGLVQTKDSEINGLWVHPSRQGTGAGTLLIRTGEKLIRDARHRVAWLTCDASNARAYAFYVHRGHAETERKRYVHESGVELEDVWMERPLEPELPVDGPERG